MQSQRTNHGVKVISDGEIFLRRIGSIINEVDRFERDFFRDTDVPENAAVLTVAAHRSAPAVDALIRYYNSRCIGLSHINITYHELSFDAVLQEVGTGSADLGIISYLSSRESLVCARCRDYGLEITLLDDGPLCAQVSRDHPLSMQASLDPDELSPYIRICFSDEELSAISAITYEPDPDRCEQADSARRIVTNSRGVLHSMILNSTGYYLHTAMH